MIKRLTLLILTFFAFGCGDNHLKNHPVVSTKENKSVTPRVWQDIDSIIYDPVASTKNFSDSLVISFESAFQKDSVKVSLGKINVFKKIISTDDRIGFATSTVIYKTSSRIQQGEAITICINDDLPVIISKYKNYRFVYINKWHGVVRALLSNKIHYYE